MRGYADGRLQFVLSKWPRYTLSRWRLMSDGGHAHPLRHAHAVEMSREGIALLVLQRQLGHAHLGITCVYLREIDNTEIIDAVRQRPAPMIPPAPRFHIAAHIRPYLGAEGGCLLPTPLPDSVAPP